jgi:hypothetical protein|tara:strand:+ start:516 stop:629 length:114 start_codon:yes stop_codon:yes gene_type:complete
MLAVAEVVKVDQLLKAEAVALVVLAVVVKVVTQTLQA